MHRLEISIIKEKSIKYEIINHLMTPFAMYPKMFKIWPLYSFLDDMTTVKFKDSLSK